jgi:hypothetical protein
MHWACGFAENVNPRQRALHQLHEHVNGKFESEEREAIYPYVSVRNFSWQRFQWVSVLLNGLPDYVLIVMNDFVLAEPTQWRSNSSISLKS